MPRTRPPQSQSHSNQQRRTRKLLLEAAAALLKRGQAPSMDDIAAEAMVSRATIYRYFPNTEALLAEAPVDQEVPEAAAMFAGDHSPDPIERLDRAERCLHAVCYRNERALRAMLAASLQRLDESPAKVPIRQNRRTDLIDAALAPVRSTMTDQEYHRLRASLSLVFGTESMIVFTDLLGLDAKAARRVKQWMIETLVKASLSREDSPR